MAKPKGRELYNVALNEVSLVDRGANKKTFYFMKSEDLQKQKANILIKSDGTADGTSVMIDGKMLSDFKSFDFWIGCPYYEEDDVGKKKVRVSFTIQGQAPEGFKNVSVYQLIEKQEKILMEELTKFFKVVLKLDDITEEQILKIAQSPESESLKKAAVTINQYSGDFPEELTASFRDLVKGILNNKKEEAQPEEDGEEEPEEDGEGEPEEDLEKKGAKYSKGTLQQLKSLGESLSKASEIINSLLDGATEEKKEDKEEKETKKTEEAPAPEEKKDEAPPVEENKLEKALKDMIQNGDVSLEKINEVIKLYSLADDDSEVKEESLKDLIRKSLSEIKGEEEEEMTLEEDGNQVSKTDSSEKEEDEDIDFSKMDKNYIQSLIGEVIREEVGK